MIMIKQTIGENASQIWQLLKEKGEMQSLLKSII